jgi:uncharacterized protein
MGVTLAAFIAELRAVGIPISLSENIDATAAMLAMPLSDRESLRSALASTLVKNSDHFGAFDLIFDIFFAGRRAGTARSDGMVNDSTDAMIVSSFTDTELNDVLFDAVLGADELLVRVVVEEAVTRFAGIERGRVAAGVYYMYKTLNKMDLDRLLDKLLAAAAAAGLTAMAYMLTADDYRRRVGDVRLEVESEIRRRLVADRGAEAVADTLRRPLPEDVDFLSASPEQLAAIRQSLQLLSKKLAARLAHNRRLHRRSTLDFRRTIRESLSNGGVPVDLIFRKPHPAKPEIMVIADISSSVSAFASFTLQLAYAIKSEFSKVRSFVFVDGIEEVTEILESSPDMAAVAQHINSGTGAVRFDGHSDYGMALENFWNQWGHQVKSRTTVIILGDARSNYHATRSRVLERIRQRSRHLYWLNPEPSYSWDTGDSVISDYGRYCDRTVECRNLRQLRTFVAELD